MSQLFGNLSSFSGKTLFISENFEEISYGDLLRKSQLLAQHILPRSLVFNLASNCPPAIAGYLAFMTANAVQLLLPARADDSIISKLASIYRPSYFYLPKGRELLANVDEICTLGNYALVKVKDEQTYRIHDDLALLLTTSGSTGSPKLVRLSYRNLRSNALAISEYLQIEEQDRPITTLPMSYSFGLSILNSHLMQGSTLILTEDSLTSAEFWKLLKGAKATTFGGVPYTFEILKKLRFDRMDLPHLKYLTQAGGKLKDTLIKEFVDICSTKQKKFFVMYGQTEATARMSYVPWNYASSKIGSVGIPIPGGEFAIAINDSELKQGELIYKGDNVCLGYAENLSDLALGDVNNGKLETGDIARRDDDGFYYIMGRSKRFLKIFGNRVNLDEIEKIIVQAGFDCACSGRDDLLKIYVTDSEAVKSLPKFLNTYTGLHHTAFQFCVVEELPRSENGKIQYSRLPDIDEVTHIV